MENDTIEKVRIGTNGITILTEILSSNYQHNYDSYERHKIETELNQTKGTLSKHSARRLRHAINNLAAICPPTRIFNPVTKRYFYFRIAFITLTLSAQQGIHTDNKIKRQLLNHFIITAKRKWNMKSYVWKAESQLNGNIHFHIAADCFIPHQELRDCWNNIQKKLGYIDLFNEKHSHIDPNSTDIHQRKRIDNLAGYLAKYFSKSGHYSKKLNKYIANEQKRQQEQKRNYSKLPKYYFNEIYRSINGRMIGYSDNLGLKNEDEIYLTGHDRKIMDWLISKFPDRLYNDDYFSFLRLSNEELLNVLPYHWLDNYKNFVQQIILAS